MSHWYITSGEQIRHNVFVSQRYKPLKKDGSEYKVIKRSMAESAGAVKSVTTILQQTGGIGWLLEWSGRLGIEACKQVVLEHGTDKIEELAHDKWTELRESAADKGSEIHKAIEDYLTRDWLPEGTNKVTCLAVDAWIDSKPELADAVAVSEPCFLYDDGQMRYAGTPDLLFLGKWLVDFKSITKKREPKLSELAQLAAYRRFGEGNEKCANLFISQETGEITNPVEWTEEQVNKGWQFFCLAYAIDKMLDEFEA